ncbi:MAG: hypothetical protein KKE50_00130 [Nanoarchaeota archaeon]|nr:hypothetical protein [Nanoarchaeota archaeon]
MKEKRELVKVEGNLIEYPFFHLGGRKDIVVSKKHEFGEVVLEDGTTVKRNFTVENVKGIPGPYDQDVLMAILRIGTKKNKLTEDIPLTIYEVAKEIDGLKHRTRVKKSIEKLASTTYISKQVVLIKENGTKYYLDDIFHILESATFLDSSQKNKRKSNQFTKVRFNRFFITNFLNDYYKFIDFGKYLSLGSPAAKKLYLYLEKKKFNKDTYQISLDNLARILPIESNKHYQIRWILKKAHEKLIEHLVIKSFEFKKDKVVYHFPQKTNNQTKELPQNTIVDELISIGITKKVAEDIFEKYGFEHTRKHIDHLKHRKAKNPPGLLVKAIMEDWAPSAEYIKEKKKEEEREKAKQKKEEEKRKKEETGNVEEKINEIMKKLTKEEIEKYNKKAEEQFKRENPDINIKFFPSAYKEIVIKKLVAEERDINKAEHISIGEGR